MAVSWEKTLNLHPSKCQIPNHSWVDWWEAEEEKADGKLPGVDLKLGTQALSLGHNHCTTHLLDTHTHCVYSCAASLFCKYCLYFILFVSAIILEQLVRTIRWMCGISADEAESTPLQLIPTSSLTLDSNVRKKPVCCVCQLCVCVVCVWEERRGRFFFYFWFMLWLWWVTQRSDLPLIKISERQFKTFLLYFKISGWFLREWKLSASRRY